MDWKTGDRVEIGTSDGVRSLVIVEGPTVTYRVTVQRLNGEPDETGTDGGPVVEQWSEARIRQAQELGREYQAAKPSIGEVYPYSAPPWTWKMGDRVRPRAGMERAEVIAHRVMTLRYRRDDGLWVGATDRGDQYTYSAESLERVEG